MCGSKRSHTASQRRGVEPVPHESDSNHALFEFREVHVVHRLLEAHLGYLVPGGLRPPRAQGGQGGGTLHPLIVDRAHDLVQGAGEDRF